MRRRPTFATPAAAEEAFYAAMGRGDVEAMMAVWADDEDAVCVHPGGPRLVGIDAIRESFAAIFQSGAVRVAVAGLRAFEHAGVAVHNLVEQVSVEGRMGSEVVSVVATNVYVRSARGWAMLLHHAAADAAAEPEPERPRGPLH